MKRPKSSDVSKVLDCFRHLNEWYGQNDFFEGNSATAAFAIREYLNLDIPLFIMTSDAWSDVNDLSHKTILHVGLMIGGVMIDARGVVSKHDLSALMKKQGVEESVLRTNINVTSSLKWNILDATEWYHDIPELVKRLGMPNSDMERLSASVRIIHTKVRGK